VAFSPDGRTLAAAAANGTILLWNIRITDSMATACKRVNRNLTRQEWQEYLGESPYQKTCEDLPDGP
jgi:WD40 repeat protein